MATMSAARSIFRSSAARSAAAKFASAAKTSAPRSSSFRSPSAANLLNSSRIFRCPAELSACLETMQPFHTATASALMTSMLAVSCRSSAWAPDDDSVIISLASAMVWLGFRRYLGYNIKATRCPHLHHLDALRLDEEASSQWKS